MSDKIFLSDQVLLRKGFWPKMSTEKIFRLVYLLGAIDTVDDRTLGRTSGVLFLHSIPTTPSDTGTRLSVTPVDYETYPGPTLTLDWTPTRRPTASGATSRGRGPTCTRPDVVPVVRGYGGEVTSRPTGGTLGFRR